MKTFNLKERRRELHLTLEQIGEYVKVGKSTVRKWETGMIENMKTDKILLLSQILKVHPLTILGIDENINSDFFKYECFDSHIYIPKQYYDDIDNIFVFKNQNEQFKIPKNCIVVCIKKDNLISNSLIAIKTSEFSDIKIMKYSSINEHTIIVNDGHKDELLDHFMGDYFEVIGEIVYYSLPANFILNSN